MSYLIELQVKDSIIVFFALNIRISIYFKNVLMSGEFAIKFYKKRQAFVCFFLFCTLGSSSAQNCIYIYIPKESHSSLPHIETNIQQLEAIF